VVARAFWRVQGRGGAVAAVTLICPAIRAATRPPLDHRSRGLLPSNRSTGAICPAGRLEVSWPSPLKSLHRSDLPPEADGSKSITRSRLTSSG